MPQYGFGRTHPETVAGHGRLFSTNETVKNGGVTIWLAVIAISTVHNLLIALQKIVPLKTILLWRVTTCLEIQENSFEAKALSAFVLW